MKITKERLFKTAAVLLGTVAGVAICAGVLHVKEILWPRSVRVTPSHYEHLRASLDHNPRSLYEFDPDVSYMLKKNYEGIRHASEDLKHVTNSMRLLGSEEIDLYPEARKVLFLGDSVTYGEGIAFEYIFTSIIQSLSGSQYLIANGSCPGWSTYQQIGFFQKYLSDIEWEAVVIAFCLNDLVKFEWVFMNETDFAMSPEVVRDGGFQEVSATVWSHRLYRIRRRFDKDSSTRILSSHNNTTLLAWCEAKWDEYERDVLTALTETGRMKNPIIVAIPTLPQIVSLAQGASEAVVLFPQKRLEAFCRQKKICFIDARAAFEGSEAIHHCYKDNLHLSRHGHELIAYYVWPRIKVCLEEYG